MIDSIFSPVLESIFRPVYDNPYVFFIKFSPGNTPYGLETTVSGIETTPAITIDGLEPVDGQTNEILKSLDLSEGEILVQLTKDIVVNNYVQVTADSVSYIGNTSDVIDVRFVFGTPPAWWLTKWSKAAGSYMQIQCGTETAIQDWPGMTLEGIEFFDKAGFGESTGVKSVSIYKTARRWV